MYWMVVLVFAICGIILYVHSLDNNIKKYSLNTHHLQAPIQIVGVAIVISSKNKDPEAMAAQQAISDKTLDAIEAATRALKKAGVRAKHDSRDNYNAGFKYAHWESKGVPLQFRMGPQEFAHQSEHNFEEDMVQVEVRQTGEKQHVPLSQLVDRVPAMLAKVQKDMLAKARRERDSRMAIAW